MPTMRILVTAIKRVVNRLQHNRVFTYVDIKIKSTELQYILFMGCARSANKRDCFKNTHSSFYALLIVHLGVILQRDTNNGNF